MPPHMVRYTPIQCNTRERCDQLQIPAPPPAWRVPEGPDNLAAAPMGGGRAWPGFEGKLHHTQRHKRRRCGGRRRVRRARAGFEIDHSEPQARVWRSRGRPGPTAPRTPAVPQATKQQGQGAGGPGCGARGRRRGLAGLRGEAPPHTATQAPPVWRAPEGPKGQAAVPVGGDGAWLGFEATHSAASAAGAEGAGGQEGQGGLRDRPLRAEGSRVAISRAAGPDGARNTSGAAKQPGPDTRKPRPADAGRGQPTQSGGKV